MAEPYVGEIKIFPYSFVPYGFLACQGQTVSVQQYQALFGAIGITFGGDGRTNFKVPNLAGLAPVGLGVAPSGGTTNWTIAATHGQETVQLIASQYPAHNHKLTHLTGTGSAANAYAPQAGSGMTTASPVQFFAAPAAAANTTAHQKTLAPYDAGGANVQPHANMQPYLVLVPCIAWLGVFPQFT